MRAGRCLTMPFARYLAAAGLLLGLGLAPLRAAAIVSVTDDIELEGFFKTQNILRTPMFRYAEFVMQRNTAQIESKYYFLRNSRAFNRFATGPLEETTLTLIGRGVYDSIYDIRDTYSEAFDKHEKLNRKFEYKLREAFVDLVLPPFTLRLGRQQVVWGETDNFRALDVINPLDLRWHANWEPWEDIRIPLWMARGIYDIGKFGPLEESFVEAVWIPWDFQPNKFGADPRRPWPFIGDGRFAVADSAWVGDTLYRLNTTVLDDKPSKKFKNGQAGARFKAIWGGVDFSLNYFYGFSADTGVKVRSDLTTVRGDMLHSVVQTVNPRSHVLGIAANYSEEYYTQSVFRLETTYTTGIPVGLAPGASARLDPDRNLFDTASRSVVMLAVDRPTWIRPLNNLRTFFLSAQFFWRRYLDYSRLYRGLPSVVAALDDRGAAIPGRFVSASRDKVDQNEFVMTFSASTSYGRAGLWQPLLVFAFDPLSTGAYNKLAMDYLWSNHVIVRLEQNLFWRISGHDPGPWAVGDIYGRPGDSRHETILSLIFQF